MEMGSTEYEIKGLFLLARTSCASNVESVDGNRVVFLLRGLLPGIELPSFVNILSTGCALHGKRRHQTNSLDFGTCLLWGARAYDLRGVEVWGVVLRENLSFRHGGCWLQKLGGSGCWLLRYFPVPWRLKQEGWCGRRGNVERRSEVGES